MNTTTPSPNQVSRRRTVVALAVAVLVVLGIVVVALAAGNKESSQQTASCADPANDVMKRIGSTTDRSAASPTRTGEAAHLDLRGVELARSSDELIVRVVLADDWLRPSNATTGSLAAVTLRGSSDGDYIVEVSLNLRTSLYQEGDAVLPDRIFDGGAMGHEGQVVEGHVPLSSIPDLDSTFTWWSRTTGLSGSNVNDPRASSIHYFDDCGTEQSPLAFPGEALTQDDLAVTPSSNAPASEVTVASTRDRPATTTTGVGQPSTTAAPPRTNPVTGEICEGVSDCVYENGIDFTALRQEIADLIVQQFGNPTSADGVNCDGGTIPPNQVQPGASFECAVTTQDYTLATVRVSPTDRGEFELSVLAPPHGGD